MQKGRESLVSRKEPLGSFLARCVDQYQNWHPFQGCQSEPKYWFSYYLTRQAVKDEFKMIKIINENSFFFPVGNEE